jgi:poly-gamma-glutamate synthesis protein (capsule biosynthesis protein)
MLRRGVVAAGAGCVTGVLLGLVAAQAPRTSAVQPSNTANISVAMTGDSIITRPFSSDVDPAFQGLIRLIRGQDAAFTNLEISLHDYESYPMVESGGLHLRGAPAIAKELVSAGFRMASFANNHALDWGTEGLRLTRKNAKAAGLLLAGVGESLHEARAAQVLETPKGRVALIAAASTFTAEARAGDSLGDIPARPGLSPLRFETTYVITPAGLSSLRAVATDLRQTLPQTDRVTFLGQTFVLGERSGRQTTPNPADVEQIGAAVRSGRELSDLTIVSVHAHEAGGTLDVPPQFLTTFAHAMIDAGADAVVGHGPHVLRAIEIYRGKPIFYSLGDFVFENETVERLPLDDYEAFGADPAKGRPDSTPSVMTTIDGGFQRNRRCGRVSSPFLVGVTVCCPQLSFIQCHWGLANRRLSEGVPRLWTSDWAVRS